MSGVEKDARGQRIEQEASAWLARLRVGGRQDQEAFEDWYAADPDHADAYDRVLDSWQAMNELSSSPVAPVRALDWRRLTAVAAILLVALLGLGFVTMRHKSDVNAPVALETRAGEIRTVALADGSRMTLDTESSVHATFDAEQRKVQLVRGRARFEVAAQPRPFVIETGGGSVTTSAATLDIGFDGKSTSVGLLRGNADVSNGLQGAVLFHLSPGQKVTIGKAGVLPYPVRDQHWPGRMASFENAPLSEVVAVANLYGSARIEFAEPELGSLRFTGTFNAADSAGLAHMLAAMFKLKCDDSVAHRFILSR